MTSRFLTVIKLAVLFTTILMVGIGGLWAAEIIAKDAAGDYAVKALAIMGVFTAGMLVVAALGGGPAGNGDPTKS
ncbi:MAG: hypothetical protein ACYTGZ_07285 [Planctomycetota bacterium]